MQTGSDADRNKAGGGAQSPGGAVAISRWKTSARQGLQAIRVCLLSVEMLLWAAFFVAAGAFLVLRYWLLPNVERYHPEIVAAASAAVGQPVTIESISADWRGLRPQLELVNVRVFDAGGREALVLPSVVNVLSWRSIMFGELRLHSFEVDDLKLAVRRDRNGLLTVAGIQIKDEKGEGKLSDWVLGQREIVIRNAEIEWVDELRAAPPLRLTALDLRMQNDGVEHAIGISARPPRELGSSIDLRAELLGRSVAQPATWSGRVFVEVGSTDLAAWRAWFDYPIDLKRGEGALRLWATLVQGKLRRVTADFSLSNVMAQLGANLPLLDVSGLQGRLFGRATQGGYEFGARHLRLAEPHGPETRPASLRIQVDGAAANLPARGSISADLLELAPLSAVAGALPLPAEFRRRLGRLAPKGTLTDARLDWTGEFENPLSFSARGRFEGLGITAYERVPGFSGLSGSLEASEKKGALHVDARQVELDLPKVFAESRTQFESLAGHLSWERGRDDAHSGARRKADERPAALHFKLAGLTFANPALAGTASGTYVYTGTGPGVIDLTAQLSRADAVQSLRYVPLVIGPALRDWLSTAIDAGAASDVRLRLRGDLYEFPFQNPAKGQFSVAAKVTRGTLDFAEGWPKIEGIDADLLFERDRIEIVGRKASMFGVPLSGVRVAIPQVSRGLVSISGQADGQTAEFLRFVQQSPVRSMISGATDGMQASGRGQLRLKIDLPLGEAAKTKVSGQYQLMANDVLVDARLPQIERASGRVEFSESSVAIRDVRGTLFGGPLSVNGATRPEGGVLVNARGEATIAGLRGLFDHPWSRFLSGGAPYTASVVAAGGSARVVVETPLTGVVSTLPMPLAKIAQDTLPLRLEIVPLEGGDRLNVSVGRFLAAEFQRRREAGSLVVQRTGVGLNQPARLPDKPGILLAGTLPALNLDRWLPLFGDDAPAAGSAAGQAATPAARTPPAATITPGATTAPGASVAAGTASASSVDLKLGSLDAFGKRLGAVTLRAGIDARGWQASVAATEMSGELSYRGEGRGRLVARLAHFSPPPDAPGTAKRSAATDLPAVDLVAERFDFRGKQLGRVEVIAQPEGANWRIEKLANTNPEAALAGKGLWVTGANSRTSLEFTLQVNDAGKYLDRVGYPDSLKGGSAKFGGTLNWAGDPLNLDYPSLTGELSLHAESGQFLEIEPGIGKLVSLMSLQMLPRRIGLDFRDVFSKGFAFDRIDSTLQVDKGVMRTKDFRMRGPAADVEIVGDADLAKETQNLRVKVVPALGGSASTVVGLLNPAYGVASLIAQSVLKNPLGNIFAYEYAVTGGWSDPKVAKVAATPAGTDRSGVPP